MSGEESIRRLCRGEPALRARLEPWMVDVLGEPPRLLEWMERYGSPLNLHRLEPFERNVEVLKAVARERGLELGVFFARKANKSLAFVEAVRRRGREEGGWGVDTASEEELRQCLDAGLPPEQLLVTAAVKPPAFLRLAVEHGVAVALDHVQDIAFLAEAVREVHHRRGPGRGSRGREPTPAVLRLSGFPHPFPPSSSSASSGGGGRLSSRFGFDVEEAVHIVRQAWKDPAVAGRVRLEGLQFHLDGYDPGHRVSALALSLRLADALRASDALRGPGHPIAHIDIGGGLPVRYLEEKEPWEEFHRLLEAAQRGEGEVLTYGNHGLGWMPHEGGLAGEPELYPFHQETDAAAWLGEVLDAAPLPRGNGQPGGTLAEELRQRDLTLRCEPGRSLLDGCGMTAARVVHVKCHPEGHYTAGLEMNRTQLRTGSADFLVDPILVPGPNRAGKEGYPGSELGLVPPGPEDAVFLTGAYCIEGELLTWRALRFPESIHPGDLVVWPNTAGYFMHFLESRSHGFPLAKNLVIGPDGEARLDAVDQPGAVDGG